MITRFLSRILVEIVRTIALTIWRLQGWSCVNPVMPHPKAVIIAYPHTSQWDFWHMLCTVLTIRRRPTVTVKQELMRPPTGWLMRAVGAVPIDRSKSNNLIEQMIEAMNNAERMLYIFTVEGSRKYTDYWKTGFYYTALGADVPIVCAVADYKAKTITLGLTIHPTGDIDADFAPIQAYYEELGKNGLYPEKAGRIALRPIVQEKAS